MTQSFYKGLDTYVVFAEDTAFGTPGTPTGSDYVDKVNSFSATIANNTIRVQGLGEGRNASHAVNGVLDCTGSMAAQLTDPSFLQYLFIGLQTGSGSVGTPYIITEADELGYAATQVNTLTIETGSEGGSNDDVMTYDGVAFNTFTLNMNVGEIVNFTADWTGRTGTSSTSTLTYAGPTNRPFTFIDSSVTIGSDTIGEVTSFSLTCNNNLSIFRALGQRLISQPIAGVRRYDFSLTMKLNYNDGSNILSGLEARGLVFDGTTTSTTPTTTATNTALTLGIDLVEGAAADDRVVGFNFEDVYFDNISTPIAIGDSDAGIVEITITGYALAGASNIPLTWYTIV